MLPPLASVDDLGARIPGGIAGDEARAAAALDDASAAVRAESRRNWTNDDGDELDLPTGPDAWRADILVKVTLSAALRSMSNPENVAREQIADYAIGYANSSTDVYLTKGERALVRKAAGLSGLWTQSTTRGDAVTTDTPAPFDPRTLTQYLPVDPAGDPIPWAGGDGY